MDCYPQAQGQSDVVFTVHWTCTGTDGATPAHTASVYTTTAVTYTAGSPYTPYAQLTNAQVVGWVQAVLGTAGVAAVEASIDTQIANQINPPVISPPLPWASK
jgi:hypothetical protein